MGASGNARRAWRICAQAGRACSVQLVEDHLLAVLVWQVASLTRGATCGKQKKEDQETCKDMGRQRGKTKKDVLRLETPEGLRRLQAPGHNGDNTSGHSDSTQPH